jgi:hypothetical protein
LKKEIKKEIAKTKDINKLFLTFKEELKEERKEELQKQFPEISEN